MKHWPLLALAFLLAHKMQMINLKNQAGETTDLERKNGRALL